MTKEEKRLYAKEYYKKNREKVIERQKRYASENLNKVAKYQSDYATKHNTDIKEYKKEYRELNRDKIKQYNKEYESREEVRCRIRNTYRDRIKNDPIFALKERIRTRIRSFLKESGFAKKSNTSEILGCSFWEFKSYFESKFLEGMSWENRDKWHIDHIIPISYAKTYEEVIQLNHFTNLQPLWGPDNLQKGNAIREHELDKLPNELKLNVSSLLEDIKQY